MITGIIRDEMGADVWGTLERVAQTGYRGIEVGAGLIENTGLPSAALVGRLGDMGLQVTSYGTQRNALSVSRCWPRRRSLTRSARG